MIYFIDKKLVMNFFKNLLLFWAMFAWWIVALNYAGLVDVNLPVSSWNKGEAELSATGTTVSTRFEWTATIANLQNIPEPSCKENEISTIEDGQVVCKVPELAKNLDCISPFGITIKEWEIIKLAKPELKKCSEEEFKCSNWKFVYFWNKTSNIPTYEEYKYDVKACRPLVVDGVSCVAPWWSDTFEDGQVFIAYEKEIVAKDQDCKFEKIACLGGQIKQKYGYKYESCSHATNFSLSYIKQNQEKLVEQKADGSISISATMTNDTSNAAKKSCNRFGRVVPNSENIYAFKDQTVPFQEDCEFEVKVCRDGEFATPNKWYEFKECFIGEWLDCKIDKTNLWHSNAATYYAKYDPKLKDCPSQVRRCWNGNPDWDNEYIYTTCNKPGWVVSASALNRCPNPFVWESKVWDHGEKWVWYFRNTVGWFWNCEWEVDGKLNKVAVECLYGTIQPIGNNVKIWRSCSKWTPKNCTTPWWTTVEHGKSVVAYENGSMGYGASCESEVRVCDDWVLWWRYQYQSCSVAQPVGCMTPWWELVAHQWTFTAFQTDSVSYGNICASQTRVCTNGVNNGSYVFRSCTVNAPVWCVYEWVSLAHGQTVTRATTPKIVWDPLEWKSECSWFSAKCNNGTMQGNLLNNPDARFTSCNALSLNN